MKKVLVGLFALLIGFGLNVHVAEAKRFGGGKSFGMQRNAPAKHNTAPAPQRQPGTPAQTAPQRSWMGPIAGLAAGLGLAALFSHLGLGAEMANFLMLALLAFAGYMLFRFLLRKNAPATPAMQYAGNAPAATPLRFDTGSAPAGSVTHAFPPGFDAAAFAREAKLNFIRLQAAFDARDLDDLRAFTTPEVFAELTLQLGEHVTADQVTDVLFVDAEVIEATEEAGRKIVSVRFTGEVREAPEAAPVGFDEVWHLVKPAQGTGGWLISGLQQL